MEFSVHLKFSDKKYGVFTALNFATRNITKWHFRRAKFQLMKFSPRLIASLEISSPKFSPQYFFFRRFQLRHGKYLSFLKHFKYYGQW